jgi:glc operon protein GlcG
MMFRRNCDITATRGVSGDAPGHVAGEELRRRRSGMDHGLLNVFGLQSWRRAPKGRHWEETLYKPKHVIVAAALLVGVAVPARAQQPPPPPTTPYGPPIGLEAAKKVMAAAEAEAVKNNWPMAIVILDSTGHIVMLHRLDNTQYGSISVAEDKAHTALDFRRPSKVFEDLVAQGGIGMRTLGLRGATPLEGGVPIVSDEKIIGAVGVSGGTATQDGQVAKVGADIAAAK